jgi:hypothetical protein
MGALKKLEDAVALVLLSCKEQLAGAEKWLFHIKKSKCWHSGSSL